MGILKMKNEKGLTRTFCAVIFLIFCFLFLNTASAQGRIPTGIRPSGSGGFNKSGGITPGSSTGTNRPNANESTAQADTSATKGLVFAKETPDSVLRVKVFLFNYTPTQVKINELWNPTLDPTGVQFADKIDALNGNYYLGKGIVGHPHIGTFPTMDGALTYNLLSDIYEAYSQSSDNVHFYQTMTPYSRLSYNSSLNKDYQVEITHTQNIIPGWNVAFDYKLICPEGIYANSGAKNHYIDFTTNYFSPDSRLQTYAGLIWQSFDIDENDGISNDSYFTQQLQSNRAGIPVNLTNAGTRERDMSAFGQVSYNLVRQVDHYRTHDSLVARTIGDTLTVLDTVKITDTIRIGNPRVLNAGVWGLALNYEREKTVFVDSTYWFNRSATLFWTNDAYTDHRWRNPLKITVGLTPRMMTAIIMTDTVKSHVGLNPFARTTVSVGDVTLQADAEWSRGFTDDLDHRYAAALEIPFDSAQNTVFSLGASLKRQAPDYQMIYDATVPLRPIKSEVYHIDFKHSELLELNLRVNHLSHNVWFDSLITVHEGTSDFWLYQAALTTRLQIGWLHLDMQQLLQHCTDQDQMPVPLWTSKNSLYTDFHLFHNALRLQVGVDVRYLTKFYVPTYDAAAGLFYHQHETQVGNYIWGDFFINLQVKRASIYAKAGHVNALWETHPNYFLLPHYPGQKFGFFWGIVWHFFD